MMQMSIVRGVHQQRLRGAADCLAFALVTSLPLSTSATSIIVVIWAVVLIPTLDWRDVRAELMTAAGGLPVALVLLGIAGMLWASGTLSDRLHGLDSFMKLLAVPLLLVQFRRSRRGLIVLVGFLAACAVVLVLSDTFAVFPQTAFLTTEHFAVPVKSGPTQSGEFVLCIFVLLYLAIDEYRSGRWLRVSACLVLATLFLVNIVFVALSRTALVDLVVLLLVLGLKKFNTRGFLLLLAVAVVIAVTSFASSQYLRWRVFAVESELTAYWSTGAQNSSGERLEFYKKSVGFIASALLIGHGTGSIPLLFQQSAAGRTGASGSATTNPHNQTFAVGIQLGVVGMIVLWAMWVAHVFLFRGDGLGPFIGSIVVIQNIVGSILNSHLFDFSQGWIYVVGVGIVGGVVRRKASAQSAGPGDKISSDQLR